MISTKSFDNNLYAKTIDNSTLYDIIEEDVKETVSAVPAGTMSDGTVALPGLEFALDPDTGFYRIGTNNLGISCGNSKILDLNGTRVLSTKAYYAPQGGDALPSYTFTSFPDNGMYNVDISDIGFATQGVRRMTVGTASVNLYEPLLLDSGNATAPGLSFVGETGLDTGIYRPSTGQVGFTCNTTPVLTLTDTSILPLINIVSATGDITATAGTMTGNIVNSTTTIGAGGNITSTGGDLISSTGNVTASAGTVSGNIVSSTTTMSAGGNITSTGGDLISSTGNVITANGSATLPSHTFGNFTGNGMYSTASTLLGFSATGANQMSINTTVDALVLAVTNILGVGDMTIDNQLGESIVFNDTAETIEMKTATTTKLTVDDGVYWKNTKSARMTNSGAQTVSNGVDSPVSFGTETYDYDGSIVVLASDKFTTQRAGIYGITFYARWAVNSTGRRYASIRVGGVDVATNEKPAESLSRTSVSYIATIASATDITFRVYQSAGGNLDLNEAVASITYIGE